MKQVDYLNLEQKYTSGVYGKRDIVIVRGKGAVVWDIDGNEYIDCTAGHGVANIGHCHPAIINALTKQAQTLITCPEIFYNDRRAEFLDQLMSLMPKELDRVFLCNSGTESMEAAIKISRLSTGRKNVIAAMRGFHGRTMGALSATYNKKYREPFEPLIEGFSHVPYNNLQKISDSVNEKSAAVILEVVQGEGGVHIANQEFLFGVQEICQQRGALLVIDEVQTGFGRTGKMFAYQHFGIQPDILCLAKSIAGGIPMGATVLGKRVISLPVGVHGSTFGGNPLAAAAALASLEVISDENLIQNAANLGEYFKTRLGEIQSTKIREVRGLGLMVGLELRQKVAPYINALKERCILVLNAGPTVLRFLPPLVITQAQIDQVIEAVNDVLQLDLGEE